MSRLVVTRGPRFDVAEWVEAPDGDRPSAAELLPRRRDDSQWGTLLFVLVAGLAAVASVYLRKKEVPVSAPLSPTVADLVTVHGSVARNDADTTRVVRLQAGDRVQTDEEGRARLRLDHGLVVVIDRQTRLTVNETGLALEKGRVFIDGRQAAKATVTLGAENRRVLLDGAQVAVAEADGEYEAYVAEGEVVIDHGGETTVAAGETAVVRDGEVKVRPEAGYEDWTHGLASPWSARGTPRRAVGELWGRPMSAGLSQTGSPLTLRNHEVRAAVVGETAHTVVRSTFFNAGAETVAGDFRMALPPEAIVSGFSVERDGNRRPARVSLADRTASVPVPAQDVLEWAGDGWLRGSFPALASGATIVVTVAYDEWLAPIARRDGKTVVVQYRYPMVGTDPAAPIGEFFAHVDAARSKPLSIGAGLGAKLDGTGVELRKSDFRPSSDWVVDVEIPAPADPVRAYLAEGDEDDPNGDTVVFRTEAPGIDAAKGTRVAIVVDTSASMEPGLLDASVALVEALSGGLGPDDQLVVLRADVEAHPIGPATLTSVDDNARKAWTKGLNEIAPGGASDLGRALEAAADRLPADGPPGLVLYIGDGWATVGDNEPNEILARLARRKSGPPRLGAVAVGPSANRFGLAGLVRGRGPLYEIASRSDAASVAASLLTDALQPTVAAVELDLGPGIERVFPRGPIAAIAGQTITAVGRVRPDALRATPLPAKVTLRWREGMEEKAEPRAVLEQAHPQEQDIHRRWAFARMEALALEDNGREAAAAVALQHELLSPWTAWVVGARAPATYVGTPISSRVLDLSVGRPGRGPGLGAAGFAPRLATGQAPDGTTLGLRGESWDEASLSGDPGLEGAVVAAAKRTIDDAYGAIRSCRNARATLRPELSGTLEVELTITGDGKAKDVRVFGVADEPLHGCVAAVIGGLTFPAFDDDVDVYTSIPLPDPEPTLRGATCSATSTLAIAARRGVWRARLEESDVAAAYLSASRQCELRSWSAKRSFLELGLERVVDGLQRLDVADQLDRAGQQDAASFVRRETIRRATDVDSLRQLRARLRQTERLPLGAFREAYEAAKTDDARLAVVRRFAAFAPHHPMLRRRELALLVALERDDDLSEAIRKIRLDPFIDPGLLLDAATALFERDQHDAAVLTFGELAEHAPRDAFVRAMLGDRLLLLGESGPATLSFEALDELLPGAAAVDIRRGLADAKAGRIDLARRRLERVAETGGREGDARMADVSRDLLRILLKDAIDSGTKDGGDVLRRALAEIALPPGGERWIVRVPPGSPPLRLVLQEPLEGAKPNDPDFQSRPADTLAPGLGHYAFDVTEDATEPVLELSRPPALSPIRELSAEVISLHRGDDGTVRLLRGLIPLPASGDNLRVKLDKKTGPTVLTK